MFTVTTPRFSSLSTSHYGFNFKKTLAGAPQQSDT